METIESLKKPNGEMFALAYAVYKNALEYAWTFIVIGAIALLFAWYFKPDGGIDGDEWVEISPNGNGDAISRREVVKETINA